jgi:hypothetical protein
MTSEIFLAPLSDEARDREGALAVFRLEVFEAPRVVRLRVVGMTTPPLVVLDAAYPLTRTGNLALEPDLVRW